MAISIFQNDAIKLQVDFQYMIFILPKCFRYYIDGRTATVDNFTDFTVLDLFLHEALTVTYSIMAAGYSGTRLWLGETGSAWGGGAEHLSNTYVAGFM